VVQSAIYFGYNFLLEDILLGDFVIKHIKVANAVETLHVGYDAKC